MERRFKVRWGIWEPYEAFPLPVRPAVISASLDYVDFFEIAAHVATDQGTRVGMKCKPPGIAQPHGKIFCAYGIGIYDLSIEVGGTDEGIVVWYSIVADGRGMWIRKQVSSSQININSNDAAEQSFIDGLRFWMHVD